MAPPIWITNSSMLRNKNEREGTSFGKFEDIPISFYFNTLAVTSLLIMPAYFLIQNEMNDNTDKSEGQD